MAGRAGGVLAASGAAVVGWLLWRRRSHSQAAVSAEESALRDELVDAHILSAHYGLDELVWNHISARVEGDDFLVTSGTEHFDEVTPASLVKSSSANANITADVIHSAIYRHRPDVGAIVHHHSTAVAAVSVFREGLKLLIQDAAAFHDKVSYHDWEGVSDDYDECERIAASLGRTSHTLIMRNHGALTVGRTIAEAWVRYFYLDRVCKVQVAVGSRETIEPPLKVLEHAAKQYDPDRNNGAVSFAHGKAEWPALRRLAARLRRRQAIAFRC